MDSGVTGASSNTLNLCLPQKQVKPVAHSENIDAALAFRTTHKMTH